ncbi:hypothetical protein XI04_26950 [Bradyrhizobium sp. CCBAU 11430]|nr:hypothetical protein [Bradyrhizobium sp. CCBAU 25360]MDA9516664.1 hypothetical protein [Bradyrhizobium sp. CCBAU 11430]
MCSISEGAQDRQSRVLCERLAERLGEMLEDIEATITAGTKLSARWERLFGSDAILHCLTKFGDLEPRFNKTPRRVQWGRP